MGFASWTRKKLCKSVCKSMNAKYLEIKNENPKLEEYDILSKVLESRIGWNLSSDEKKSKKFVSKFGGNITLEKNDTLLNLIAKTNISEQNVGNNLKAVKEIFHILNEELQKT